MALTVEPFPYQDEAIDKALDRGNLLIAYGMGLGKTLVQIAICEELMAEGAVECSAIVVPASLKWQWAQALVWATDVTARQIVMKPRSKNPQRIKIPLQSQVVVIDGTPDQRDAQYASIRQHRPEYVILGYENVINDWRYVRAINPELIALDEATAIKSFQAERSVKIKKWGADFRFALTGTPIDNRPEELYSIMEWVSPGELGRADIFDRTYVVRDQYGRPKRYKNLDVLHKKTKIFAIRKTRFDPDVASFMPKDFHKDFSVDLVGQTKKMYKKVAADLIEHLSDLTGYGGFDVASYYTGESSVTGDAAQGEAMSRFSALTMLCDHPRLLLESAVQFQEWFSKAEQEDGLITAQTGSKYAWSLLQEGELDWVNEKTTSPKFDAVLAEIKDLLDERGENKIILFSFAKPILRYFRDALPAGVSVIFDGDMNTTEKEQAKQRFKTNPDVRVFLSSDAGGMGVDLPEANYLINYNHPWSAGKADQRNSRHIRAGSKWAEVWVLNYLVTDSVEAWKYGVLDLKRRVGSAILDGGPTQKGAINFDVGSLLQFLRDSPL